MGKDAAKKPSPPVSKEELNYRKRHSPAVNSIVNMNPLCTSCNQSLKMNIIKRKAFVHPFLETLLCEKCFTFYGDGEFSVDEDGSDKYCRWCGQGGTIFQCSTCPAGFCKKCIKRNLSRSILDEVEGDEWKCFCCNVKPLYELRALASAVVEHAESANKKKESRKRLREEGDSISESQRPTKKANRRNLEKPFISHFKDVSVKLTSFVGEVVAWTQKTKSNSDVAKLKCKRKAINSLESIEEANNGLMTLLETAEKDIYSIKEKVQSFYEEWKRTVDEVNRRQLELESSNSETTESYESSNKTEKEEKSEDSENDGPPKKEEGCNEESDHSSEKTDDIKQSSVEKDDKDGKDETERGEQSKPLNEENKNHENHVESDSGSSPEKETKSVNNGETAEIEKSGKQHLSRNQKSESILTGMETTPVKVPVDQRIACQGD